MMARILFAAALSISATAPMAHAARPGSNGLNLNGLQWNALTNNGLGSNAITENGLGNNGLGSNAITENAITENTVGAVADRAHLKGFTVNVVTLPDGTVVGW